MITDKKILTHARDYLKHGIEGVEKKIKKSHWSEAIIYEIYRDKMQAEMDDIENLLKQIKNS